MNTHQEFQTEVYIRLNGTKSNSYESVMVHSSGSLNIYVLIWHLLLWPEHHKYAETMHIRQHEDIISPHRHFFYIFYSKISLSAMIWMLVSPQNSDVETLLPMWCNRRRCFWELMKPWGWGLHEWNQCLYQREQPLPSSKNTVRRCLVRTSKKLLTRSWPCWCHDVGLPASRIVRNKSLLCISHPVCGIVFMIEAQTD